MTADQLPADATKEEIAEAYERGWRDACDAFLDAIAIARRSFLGSNTSNPLRPGTMTHSIIEIIRAQPALDSAALQHRVAEMHPAAKPGTIRQTIHYLRKKGSIEKFSGGWFRS
jgi:hypothetical protein